MAYTPEQQKVIRSIIRIGRKRRVPRKYIKAALETGAVESTFHNLPGGDADSQGWRQERASLYPNPRNLKASINRFYNEAKAHDSGQPAGRLAADVQRPQAQYRGRYHDAAGTAKQILNSFGGSPSGGGSSRGSRKGGGFAQNTTASVQNGKLQVGGTGLADLLASQLQSNTLSGAPVSAPAEPTFSARRNLALPEGYPAAASTSAPTVAPKLSVADQLRAIHSGATGTALSPASVTVDQTTVSSPGGIHGKTVEVGDSLAVGTGPYLKQLVGGKVKVNAQVGRSSKASVRALRGMKGYDRVIFDAGTNDPSAKAFVKSLRRVDKLSGHAPVYVPIVNGPGAARKNAAARAYARQSKDVRLVRWHGALADGIHPQNYGQRAARIAAVLNRDAPRGMSVGGGRGKVLGHPIDRSGVHTKAVVVRFAEKVAGVYGHPIRLGTGTRHNQMTTSGNVSDHWSGHALDLPATGAKLTRMGQAALIAAGMNPKKARRIHGGLFNVGGHQIIFNTNEGGNHYNHLHVSAY